MTRLGGTLALCLAAITLAAACSKKKPKRAAKPDPAVAKEVRAHVQRIFGGALVPVSGKAGGPVVFQYAGGRVELHARRQGPGLRMRVKVTGVKLQTLAASESLRGTLEADGQLTTGRAKGLRGHVTLRCVKCELGGKKIQLSPRSRRRDNPLSFGGITLPTITLGQLRCRIDLSGQRATFTDCAARSADVRITLTGRLDLRDPLAQSLAKAKLRVTLNDALLQREPKWRAIQIALSRGPAGGGFSFTISGRLAAPRIRLDRRR